MKILAVLICSRQSDPSCSKTMHLCRSCSNSRRDIVAAGAATVSALVLVVASVVISELVCNNGTQDSRDEPECQNGHA